MLIFFTDILFPPFLLLLVGLSYAADCSQVQCPEILECPNGTESVQQNFTDTQENDADNECCILYECTPCKYYKKISKYSHSI